MSFGNYENHCEDCTCRDCLFIEIDNQQQTIDALNKKIDALEGTEYKLRGTVNEQRKSVIEQIKTIDALKKENEVLREFVFFTIPGDAGALLDELKKEGR